MQHQLVTRWRALLAALAMLAGGLVGVTAVAAPAQAACYETNDGASVGLYWGGVRKGVEDKRSPETCNRNGVYYGIVKDTYTDGNCVSILYYDPGYTYVGTQATSCDSAGYNYTFWDQTGDDVSRFRGKLTKSGYYTDHYYENGAY